MKNNQYCIDENLIQNYVKTINGITMPMSQIKEEMIKFEKSDENVIPKEYLKCILAMTIAIKGKAKNFPKEKMNIILEVIRQIMEKNNGVISTRMIEPLNISREYISILEKKKEIEKIGRGMYLRSDTMQDDFYSFQQKYKKTIFSHMNALYFYGMTEELPYVFTITVSNGYHNDSINKICNVFYVEDKFYELGLSEVETPNGNRVRVYNIERSICDIIRSKNRMDFEQVKKSLREYVKRKDKNLLNLSKYAKEMGIEKEVMEMVGMYYE